jgi:transcriptional regulator GlxA family with amidase domain
MVVVGGGFGQMVHTDCSAAIISIHAQIPAKTGAKGYNSPAQFSREYKRHFGFPPSATLAAV